MTPIDVAKARATTPGCERVLHLDHAGASLMSQPVLDAVVAHLRRSAEVGGYRAAAEAAPALDDTYGALATLLGCDTGEVALTDSATRAWTSAVYALPLTQRDQIITTRSEYGSNAIALLQLRARSGCELVLVDDDEAGAVDLDALARALEHGSTAFVSLTHVPTQSGLVNPAAEVGRLCREAGTTFVLDACQSAGQLPLDVADLGCHVLTATGRKFLRGPRGVGVLYVDHDLAVRLEPIVLDMFSATWVEPGRYEVREDARRFELWESDVAGRIGLGVAVWEALDRGVEEIAARIGMLATSLRDRLQDLDGVTVRDRGHHLCAITTFTVDGIPAQQVADRLRGRDVNVSVAVASSAQHDLPHRGLTSVVRASVHYLTTTEELDRFIETLAELT